MMEQIECRMTEMHDEPETQLDKVEPVRTDKKQRLLSLDVFRGIAVLLMLLVNNIGPGPGTPAHLQHANWASDVHLADLAFPWFLLIVGIAIPFSAASFRKTGQPLWRYDLRVLRRTALLIVLGCVLISVKEWHPMISIGTLQLIGVDFAIAAFLYQMPAYRRGVLSLLALLAYWAAIKFIPVPHLGVGVFEQGHNLIEHLNDTYLTPLGNTFLTPQGVSGLPVVVPTSALVLIGTLIGDFLRIEHMPRLRKALWLLVGGIVLVWISEAWSLSLVFNKPLWTSPFILYTAGAGAVLLALLYYLLDVREKRGWAFPLAVFGANALLAYILSELCKPLLWAWFRISTWGWFHVSLYIGCWWLLCWVLYRKRWFLKV